MSNAWIIYPEDGDNISKGMLIPDIVGAFIVPMKDGLCFKLSPQEEFTSY